MKDNRNLLEELVGYVPESNKVSLLETRGNHVINSAINLMAYIRENFSNEEADDLEKRLILAIKNKDIRRFNRGIANIDNTKDPE